MACTKTQNWRTFEERRGNEKQNISNLVRYVVHRYIVQALLRIHECFKLLDLKRYNFTEVDNVNF